MEYKAFSSHYAPKKTIKSRKISERKAKKVMEPVIHLINSDEKKGGSENSITNIEQINSTNSYISDPSQDNLDVTDPKPTSIKVKKKKAGRKR